MKKKQTEWWCRKKGTYPNVVVRRESIPGTTYGLVIEKLSIGTFGCVQILYLDKRLARTLATRILECLDDLAERRKERE